jgi:hypothetical protein
LFSRLSRSRQSSWWKFVLSAFWQTKKHFEDVNDRQAETGH